MVSASALQQSLCHRFCDELSVREVEDGLAIATAFRDGDGDPLTMYALPEEDGWRLADDGDYLPGLMASGIDILNTQRSDTLDQILYAAGAYWDRDTYEIRSARPVPDSQLPTTAMRFLTGLIRARDMALMTREAIRSTFRDDAYAALKARFSNVANVEADVPVSEALSDVPADFLLSPHNQGRRAAIFVVTRNERLTEALLLQSEADRQDVRDVSVIALLEDEGLRGISLKNFKRAQNRLDALPFFRGDETAAISRIAKVAGLPQVA